VNATNSFTSVVKDLDGFEDIAAQISKLTPEAVMLAYFQPMGALKCGFRVLNHGDDWINNMMFKVNAEDVKLLDFQNSYWGSPTGDLLYFLFTSVNDDVKIDSFDELVGHYHRELVESLRKLSYGAALPSLDEIHDDFIAKRQYGEHDDDDVKLITMLNLLQFQPFQLCSTSCLCASTTRTTSSHSSSSWTRPFSPSRR
jgi:hypothetical protein